MGGVVGAKGSMVMDDALVGNRCTHCDVPSALPGTSTMACWPMIFLPLFRLFVRLNPASSMKMNWCSTAATSSSGLSETHMTISEIDMEWSLCEAQSLWLQYWNMYNLLYTVLRVCINCGTHLHIVISQFFDSFWIAFKWHPVDLLHPEMISAQDTVQCW